MAEYLVMVGIENDETKARFEPGETCTDQDFSADVIANWLDAGVLKAKPKAQKIMKGKEE